VNNGLNTLSKSDLPKTRKELVALIFKIAFLEAMALSIILPSVASTGEIPYTLNSVTLAQAGPNNQLENVIHGQPYCVGVQSTGLIVRSANPIVLVTGAYAPRDVNVTGIYINMQLQVVNAIISNTFTQGNCGTIRGSVGAGSMYYATLNLNVFINGVSAIKLSNVAVGDTIYLGFVIVVQGTIDIQLRTPSFISQPSTLVMQEQV
jgi:hypothetical protein